MKEELTTKMHQEFLCDEIPDLDIRVMGVRGANKGGMPLDKALEKYNLTLKEYQDNFERVLFQP